MNTIEMPPTISEEATRRLLSRPAGILDGSVLSSTEDVCVTDQTTGRVVLYLLRKAITLDERESARALSMAVDRCPLSVSRREAAGRLRLDAFKRDDLADVQLISPTSGYLIRKDGHRLKQPMSNPVASYNAGWRVSRFGGLAETGRVNSKCPEEWEAAGPFFRGIAMTIRDRLPVLYDSMKARAALSPGTTIHQTPFTSCAINVNYESRYHFDRGDWKDGYSTLTVLEGDGQYGGGLLVLPRYELKVDVRDGDLVLFQAHVDVHGNTRIKGKGRRTSFVTYIKHELGELAQRRET